MNKLRVGGAVSRQSHKLEELGANPGPATIGSHIIWHDKVGQSTITRQGLEKLIEYMEKNLKEMEEA